MTYKILFKPSAVKQGDKLPKKVQTRLRKAINSLQFDPHLIGSKKIKGEENLYRIRVGDYRIIYEIDNDQLIF